MSPADFCYWLRGLFEVAQPASLNEEQTRLIGEHLDRVFAATAPQSSPLTQEQQRAIDMHTLLC